MQVLAAAMPRMKMDMAEQMKEAQQLYLKYGITTVQEGAAMAQTMQGLTALQHRAVWNWTLWHTF